MFAPLFSMITIVLVVGNLTGTVPKSIFTWFILSVLPVGDDPDPPIAFIQMMYIMHIDMLSSPVGAVVLTRAVDDEIFSKEILTETGKRL